MDEQGRTHLALTRKPGESVLIGDVRVTVTDVDRNKVRLLIQAHPDVEVLREELLDREERDDA